MWQGRNADRTGLTGLGVDRRTKIRRLALIRREGQDGGTQGHEEKKPPGTLHPIRDARSTTGEKDGVRMSVVHAISSSRWGCLLGTGLCGSGCPPGFPSRSVIVGGMALPVVQPRLAPTNHGWAPPFGDGVSLRCRRFAGPAIRPVVLPVLAFHGTLPGRASKTPPSSAGAGMIVCAPRSLMRVVSATTGILASGSYPIFPGPCARRFESQVAPETGVLGSRLREAPSGFRGVRKASTRPAATPRFRVASSFVRRPGRIVFRGRTARR